MGSVATVDLVGLDQRRKDQRFFQDQHWEACMEGLSRGKPGKRAAITGKGKEEVGKKQEQEGRGRKRSRLSSRLTW